MSIGAFEAPQEVPLIALTRLRRLLHLFTTYLFIVFVVTAISLKYYAEVLFRFDRYFRVV